MAWYEELYEFMYLEKASLFLPDTMIKFTLQEVDFLEQVLDIKVGDSILDIGCGLGRHSFELAQRGYEVTGFDLSEKMIERAAQEAENRSLVIDFIEGDMRHITWEEEFKAVIFMDVTFGIFDDEENEKVINNTCKALKPGGEAFFAMFNPYFWATHPHTRHFREGNTEIVRKYRFNALSGRIEDSQLFLDYDRKTRRELPLQSLRVYTPPEMLRMCKTAGFNSFDIFGDKGDFMPDNKIQFDAEKSLGMFIRAVR